MKKKKILILSIVLFLISISMLFTNTFGMHYYEKLDFVTGLVTASALNVRAGPRYKLQNCDTSAKK